VITSDERAGKGRICGRRLELGVGIPGWADSCGFRSLVLWFRDRQAWYIYIELLAGNGI